MEVPRECVVRAVEVAGGVGTRAVLNLAPPFEVPRTVLENLDPLVVNANEAAFLLGDNVEGVEAALAAASNLLARGPKSAVVTVGADGAVFAEEGDAGHAPAQEVEVVDTTGAGDAFVGALALRLARGDSLRQAVGYAVKAGAAAVTREGAQGALPTPDVLEAP
ncbi:MAG TPA: PfkB family carbohydrate kinase, partial [Rubrobacter sp.]|nr:PfkB family carbohydrate kinase [Rubrobacter sp.]